MAFSYPASSIRVILKSGHSWSQIITTWSQLVTLVSLLDLKTGPVQVLSILGLKDRRTGPFKKFRTVDTIGTTHQKYGADNELIK